MHIAELDCLIVQCIAGLTMSEMADFDELDLCSPDRYSLFNGKFHFAT